MRQYGFYLIRIFPYKDRIVDLVLIWEKTGHRKPVFWHILRSAYLSFCSCSDYFVHRKYKMLLPTKNYLSKTSLPWNIICVLLLLYHLLNLTGHINDFGNSSIWKMYQKCSNDRKNLSKSKFSNININSEILEGHSQP